MRTKEGTRSPTDWLGGPPGTLVRKHPPQRLSQTHRATADGAEGIECTPVTHLEKEATDGAVAVESRHIYVWDEVEELRFPTILECFCLSTTKSSKT